MKTHLTNQPMTKESQPHPLSDKHHFISSARRRRIAAVHDEGLQIHSSSQFSPSRQSTERTSPIINAVYSLHHRMPSRKTKCTKLRLSRTEFIARSLILITVTVSLLVFLWTGQRVATTRVDLEQDEDVLQSKFFHLKEEKGQKNLRTEGNALLTKSSKRIVFHSIPAWDRPEDHSWFKTDQSLSVSPGQESPSQPEPNNMEYDKYVPMQPWQMKSFPTCNTIHEFDLEQHGGYSTFDLEDRVLDGRKALTRKYTYTPPTNSTGIIHDPKMKESSAASYNDDLMFILGRGWFRHTWKLISGSSLESAVLKTLRFDRDFLAEYYELHRRDAIAMERLTKSPYIINVYAACGPSAINEFADFIPGFHNFKDFAKQLRDKDDDHVLRLKLQIATMIALGVQHVHEIDGVGNATMVHYDINPMNVAITFGGIPKLNDFNVAEFLRWDIEMSERHPFVGRFKEPWWRAPEEMQDSPLLDEKVDVYSLGNILYMLLTGHSPRGQCTKERIDEQRDFVKRGILPRMPKKYMFSQHPATLAMVTAIHQCYHPDPKGRMGARDIASGLLHALDELN